MADKSAAGATTAEVASSPEAKLPRKKEELYRIISTKMNKKVEEAFRPVADRAAKKMGGEELKLRQVFGDQDARNLLVDLWTGLLDILTQPDPNGTIVPTSVGIPGGFGSLQLTTAGATTKKTPQGQVVKVDKRWRCKYAPGKTVSERLEQLPPPPQDEATSNGASEAAPAQATT